MFFHRRKPDFFEKEMHGFEVIAIFSKIVSYIRHIAPTASQMFSIRETDNIIIGGMEDVNLRFWSP